MANAKVKAVSDQGKQLKDVPRDVVLTKRVVQAIALEVEGTAALIQNCFSQKSVEQMLRKHMGHSQERERKNPRQLIENATVRNTDGKVCLPPVAFKKSMLSVAGQIKSLKKTQLRAALFVEGQSVPITYSSMTPRMDICRTSGMSRTPDVRFRPQFNDWKARLVIQYSDTISVDAVVDSLDRAGSSGMGEWRPERDGTFGTFRIARHITDPHEVAEVRDLCAVPIVPLVIPDWALDMNIDVDVLRKIMGAQAPEGNPAESREATEADLDEEAVANG